ncbi:MAG: hypothetical protein DRO46_04555 [Candidatus Hecatellales archaeon]|nr:MAG: hypothetical protein DRO46_04555 [Candidatus Hecatellales archaeon]
MIDEKAVPRWTPEEEKAYKKCCWKNLTVHEALAKASKRYGADRKILFSADTGEAYSYGELLEGSRRLAASLLKLKVEPGYTALLQLNNTPLFLHVWLAFSRLRIPPLHVDTKFRLSEVKVWGETLKAEIYVIPGVFRGYSYYEMAKRLRRELPSLRFIFEGCWKRRSEIPSVGELLEKEPEKDWMEAVEQVKADPYKVSHFLLTGGTTGLPKIIARTHADYLYGAEILAEASRIGMETRALIAPQLTHNAGFVYSLAVLLKGGRLYLTDRTDGEGLLERLEKFRITFMLGVPTLYYRILKCERLESFNLKHLQVVLSVGQAMPPEMARRLEERLEARFQNLYGASEGFSLITGLDDPPEVRFRAAGKPTSPYDRVRLVDPETGREVQVGQPGELQVKGPRVVKGYYGDPNRTRENFTEDGYYRSGDLLYRDQAGYFYFAGRLRDIINRGGLKVGAEEVEGYVTLHPGVKEAAAVGMPDPELGERICVFIVPEEGVKPPSLEEIRRHMERLEVAKYKWPERLEIVDKLPKSMLGKIQRWKLKEQLKKGWDFKEVSLFPH